jgi:hypothetical protein
MRGMRSPFSLSAIGVAVAALSCVVFAGPAPHRVVRVGIMLEGAAAASRHVPAMIAEADTIWRPYGVAIVRINPSEVRDLAASDVQLSLTFAPAGTRGKDAAGLGAIWFQDDGLPSRSLTIDADFVAAMVRQAGMDGRPMDGLPQAAADQMIRRGLGRVLAHEIGHFLLASPAHSRTGLMRATFNSRSLGAFERVAFRLDAGALPRLQARLARLESLDKPVAAAGGETP